MMFTIQNNPEYKRTSIKVAKVAAGFIKKLKLSKSHKLWHWAYEKVKKMNNNKKKQQNGEIVDMNAISFCIDEYPFIEPIVPADMSD